MAFNLIACDDFVASKSMKMDLVVGKVRPSVRPYKVHLLNRDSSATIFRRATMQMDRTWPRPSAAALLGMVVMLAA